MTGALAGKTAVVTGSTRGIGLAIARALADEGASVVVNARRAGEALNRAIAGLNGGAARHLAVAADVTAVDQIAALEKATRERFGRCDLLVNNAGFTRFIPHAQLDDLSEEIFDRTIATNLRAPFFCVRAFTPMLRASRPALVVNVASIAAVSAVGSSIAYGASKAAVVNMTKSLARVLAPDVRVNSVSPGLIDSDLTRDFGAYRAESLSKTPLGRLGTADDVAQVVLALATTLTFTTGADLICDGGRLLS
jgi:3-oxoacyl-[acyl-carrier protein] reductase